MMIEHITKIKNEDLDDINLGHLVSDVNRYFSHIIDNKLSEYNLTRSQAHFLLALSKKDHISQEELGSMLNMTEGTVARTIKRLEDKEFIIREINPNDKRKKVVILSKRGQELIEKIIANNELMRKKLESTLPQKELNDFKLTLIKIVEIMKE